MSDLKVMQEKLDELGNVSNITQRTTYTSREISIAEIISDSDDEISYLVKLVDEDLIIPAILVGLLGEIRSKHKPKVGEYVLVVHKSGSDAFILSNIDQQRAEKYSNNTGSNIYNFKKVMKCQSP